MRTLVKYKCSVVVFSLNMPDIYRLFKTYCLWHL